MPKVLNRSACALHRPRSRVGVVGVDLDLYVAHTGSPHGLANSAVLATVTCHYEYNMESIDTLIILLLVNWPLSDQPPPQKKEWLQVFATSHLALPLQPRMSLHSSFAVASLQLRHKLVENPDIAHQARNQAEAEDAAASSNLAPHSVRREQFYLKRHPMLTDTVSMDGQHINSSSRHHGWALPRGSWGNTNNLMSRNYFVRFRPESQLQTTLLIT